MTTTQRKPATNTFGQISNLYQDQINPNLPLGAAKKNRRVGNPYLKQVKEIDKEIARLEGILQKALKGSDNRTRDLKILNNQLKSSGDLNRNKLGIGRRFWQRKGIGEQINAYKARKKQLTKFLGDPYIVAGRQNTPQIKGFTPTFMRDPDSATRSIKSYYIRAYDSKANTRDNKHFEMAKQDYLRSNDGGFGNMSEIEIAKAVESELPEGNMYRSDSKYYIYNYNEYGEKTTKQQSSESKTAQAVNLSIKNRRSSGYQEGDLTPNEVTFGSQQFVGRGTDVLMPDGGSTSLSIARRDFGRYKKGDMLSGMTRSERRRYNRKVLNIGS